MSEYPDMMTAVADLELADRLERLTGDPAEECVPRYRSEGAAVAKSPPLREALRRFSALADQRRLIAIYLLARHRSLCACEIQAATDLTHPAVSYHMSILLDAGLVECERRGKWTHYRLSDEGRNVVVRGGRE